METATSIFSALLEEPEQERPPEETVNVGDVNPSWMTPLEDFSIGTTAYRWFRLIPGTRDLEHEHCGDDGDGDPLWLEDTSYLDIIGHWHSDFALVHWALENGISPGQPFLVCFEKPIWSKSGGYEGPEEWDADYPWEVVRILPRSDRAAADSWDRAIRAINRGIARRERRAATDLERRLASPGKWVLQETYTGEWRQTLNLHLVSKFKLDRWGGTPLLSSSSAEQCDRRTTFSAAFWKLVASFQKTYPTLDPYLVVRLGAGRVDVTKWDHLRLQNREDHPEL